MFFLATNRLKFRCWTDDDLSLARTLWGDPRVTHFLSMTSADAAVTERLQREIARQKQFGLQYWPTFLIENDALVGCCGLQPYKDIFELGFHLRPEFWGKGIALEAAHGVMKYGFYALGATELFAGHHPENMASKKVLEKLGFVYTGDAVYEGSGRMEPGYRKRRK
jgi:RimJ/RimL family protein N-acetyltransferase